MNNNNTNTNEDLSFLEEESSGGLQFKDILFLFIHNLHWFILCAIIGGGLAFYKVKSEEKIYSSTTSPIVFTEDLRTIMNVKTEASSDLSKADVYFIYNDLDTESAKEILSMLSDIVSVKTLCINMNSGIEYNEKISSELPVCKIGVVYYDYASDWALSFSRRSAMRRFSS